VGETIKSHMVGETIKSHRARVVYDLGSVYHLRFSGFKIRPMRGCGNYPSGHNHRFFLGVLATSFF